MRSFIVVVTVLVSWCAQASAQPEVVEPLYIFDPAMNAEALPPAAITTDSPVVIKQEGKGANLSLQTESPFSAYLGAGSTPEPSAEELRLLPGKEHNPLEDYHLEAGVGLHVEDKASLSLGYRFNNPPSLINARRNEPLSLTGDLRISFDIKVPF